MSKWLVSRCVIKNENHLDWEWIRQPVPTWTSSSETDVVLSTDDDGCSALLLFVRDPLARLDHIELADGIYDVYRQSCVVKDWSQKYYITFQDSSNQPAFLRTKFVAGQPHLRIFWHTPPQHVEDLICYAFNFLIYNIDNCLAVIDKQVWRSCLGVFKDYSSWIQPWSTSTWGSPSGLEEIVATSSWAPFLPSNLWQHAIIPYTDLPHIRLINQEGPISPGFLGVWMKKSCLLKWKWSTLAIGPFSFPMWMCQYLSVAYPGLTSENTWLLLPWSHIPNTKPLIETNFDLQVEGGPYEPSDVKVLYAPQFPWLTYLQSLHSQTLTITNDMNYIDLSTCLRKDLGGVCELWFQVYQAQQPVRLADLWLDLCFGVFGADTTTNTGIIRDQVWPLYLQRELCPFTWVYVFDPMRNVGWPLFRTPYENGPRTSWKFGADHKPYVTLQWQTKSPLTSYELRVGSIYSKDISRPRNSVP